MAETKLLESWRCRVCGRGFIGGTAENPTVCDECYQESPWSGPLDAMRAEVERLGSRVAELEARADREDSYRAEQNERGSCDD